MSYILQNKDNIPENGEYMFRMNSRSSYLDLVLNYDVYKISSRTPNGVWIVPTWCNLLDEVEVKLDRKFIRNGGGKRFAYPTREKAKQSFIYRKIAQIGILERQLDNAKMAYTTAGGKLPIPSRIRLLFDEDCYN